MVPMYKKGARLSHTWKNFYIDLYSCMHELPFGALFCHYDESTSGPSSFSGPLGTQAHDSCVSALEMVEFKLIKFEDFPILSGVIQDLSNDQSYVSWSHD